MPGPAPKPPDQRQRANKPRTLRVVPGGLVGRTIPPPPRGLLKKTREQWDAYWTSDVAQLAEPATDTPAVERLFTLYDERRRAFEAFRKDRLIVGSQGQPVLNPLGRMIEKCDKEVRVLEDRLGLTPKARLALGIAFGEAAKSLDQLNQSLSNDLDDDDADDDAQAAGST